MKYYIDFDNTLFDTPKLTAELLVCICNEILTYRNEFRFEELYAECVELFNREHYYDIFELAKYFSSKYDLNSVMLIKHLGSIMLDTNEYIYKDTIPFLEKLKADGHILYLLSHAEGGLKYQSSKISGSGICNYFDALYITSLPKYELDLNYEDGIFIDDNPTDLLGLYSNNPTKVIRIRRNDNKYSSEDIDNPNIIEFSSLDEFEY